MTDANLPTKLIEMGSRLDTVENMVKQNEKLFDRSEKSMSTFLTKLTIAIAVAGSLAIANAFFQADRISESVRDAKERIDAIVAQTKPAGIDLVDIKNEIDDTDNVYAEPQLGYDSSNRNFDVFVLSLSLNMRVKYQGNGLNHVNGIFVKFDQKFIDNFFPGQNNNSVGRFRTGFVYNFDYVPVSPDYFFGFGLRFSSYDRDCDRVEKAIPALLKTSTLGSVEVTPVFDQRPAINATKVFNIVATPANNVYGCSDLVIGKDLQPIRPILPTPP